jgi:hypothetical protein
MEEFTQTGRSVTVRTVTGGGEKTSAAYLKRWEQLWARYARKNLAPEWPGFIAWLESCRPALRPATWRQYRAAVVYVLYLQNVPDASSLHARLMEQPLAIQDRHDLPARTSSYKSKTLKNADMDALVKHLGEHGGRWDIMTGQWLVWGLMTGLRPIEWQFVGAHQDEKEVILRVHNAKYDEHRAHGPERTVHVNLTGAGQEALLEFIRTVQTGEFTEVYEGCRLALWRATRALWPRRKKQPSLYSARHQFAADAKSAGLAPEVIAALMGHAVTSTHQVHYGKRRSGRGCILVEAEAADVARVVERTQHKNTIEGRKTSLTPVKQGGSVRT